MIAVVTNQPVRKIPPDPDKLRRFTATPYTLITCYKRCKYLAWNDSEKLKKFFWGFFAGFAGCFPLFSDRQASHDAAWRAAANSHLPKVREDAAASLVLPGFSDVFCRKRHPGGCGGYRQGFHRKNQPISIANCL